MRENPGVDQKNLVQSYSTRIAILCNHCRWRIINLDLEGEYCHAYPSGVTEGIPEKFILGEEVHDTAQVDQKGNFILEPEEGREDLVKKILGK